MRQMGLLVLIAVVSIVFFVWLFNHSGFFPYSHEPLQYMPNMHHTKALIPQRGSQFFKDGAGVRTPPEGSIPRDISQYLATQETPASEMPRFANRVAATLENVKRGQQLFMTYCVVCHGPAGYGDGLVVPPFPAPPSLQSEKVRSYADSQLFHIITVGQNTMGAYGPWIREEDRWKLIHFIRVLQRSENPTAEDLVKFSELTKSEADKK